MICLEHILLTNVKRIVSKLYYLNSRLLIINTQYSSADICNVSHLQSDDRLCNNLHSWGPLPCSLGTSQRDQRLCKTIKLYYIGVCVMCTMYLISLHVHRSKRILNIPVFFLKPYCLVLTISCGLIQNDWITELRTCMKKDFYSIFTIYEWLSRYIIYTCTVTSLPMHSDTKLTQGLALELTLSSQLPASVLRGQRNSSRSVGCWLWQHSP